MKLSTQASGPVMGIKSVRRLGLAAVCKVTGLAGHASAALLVYEPFNYTSGQGLSGLNAGQAYSLGGQSNTTGAYTNKWYPRATTGLGATYVPANDAVISSGSLSYTGLAASVGNSTSYGAGGYTPNLGWLNNTPATVSPLTAGDGVSSGSIYYSLIFNVSDITNLVAGSTRGFISALNNGTGATGTTNPSSAPANIWIRPSLAPGAVTNVNFEIGIGKSNTSDAAVWDGINHTVGDVIFAVAKYTFNTGTTTDDTVQLYVNPTASTLGFDALEGTGQQASLGPSTAGGGADVGANPGGSIPSIKSVFLRQAATGTNVPNAVNIDELRVGTTWAEVTPPVPEPAAISMLAMGLAGFAARRRR